MHIERLTTTQGLQSITLTMNYEEMHSITDGLYQLTKPSVRTTLPAGKDYTQIYTQCAIMFDMMKHGNIQPTTLKTMNQYSPQKDTGFTPILTPEEAKTFNAYLKDGDFDTAFKNTDWNHIYSKIVGEENKDRMKAELTR